MWGWRRMGTRGVGGRGGWRGESTTDSRPTPFSPGLSPSPHSHAHFGAYPPDSWRLHNCFHRWPWHTLRPRPLTSPRYVSKFLRRISITTRSLSIDTARHHTFSSRPPRAHFLVVASRLGRRDPSSSLMLTRRQGNHLHRASRLLNI